MKKRSPSKPGVAGAATAPRPHRARRGGAPASGAAEGLLAARLALSEFAHAHTMDELLQRTLDECERLTHSSIGFFHFVDDDQRRLRLQNWSSNTLKSMCTAQGKGQHYALDEAGVWVDCVRERRPVIHNDYASLPHRRGMPRGHARVVRELVVPVLRGDQIAAILGVGNKPTDYDEHDVEVVERLASLAWDVVLHKRSEEDLRRLNAELEERVSQRTAALEANRAQLERLNEDKNRLLGMAAHDLRNPLSIIQGFAAVLRDDRLGTLTAAQIEIIELIRASGRRMLELVNNLLDLSTIEAGRLDLARCPQDVAAIVRRAVSTHQLLAAPKQITLEVVAEEGLPPLPIDAPRFEQVLCNLLGNAIKFSPAGTQVVVDVRRRADEVVISVADRGVGVAPADVERIFGAYVVGAIPATGGERGTGLGLAIARRLVEAHGGRIWVERRAGAGSQFFVALPL